MFYQLMATKLELLCFLAYQFLPLLFLVAGLNLTTVTSTPATVFAVTLFAGFVLK